jgi:NADH:ubiquinone oxidoreductase subunit 6 (subunit J)
MNTFLTVLVVLAMLGTLGVLGAGLIGMARGGSAQTSNKLMRYRILLQFVALALFGILMLLLKS